MPTRHGPAEKQNSIATSSLGAAIINRKYVNSMSLNRISQELAGNDIDISRQTMANWILRFAQYFNPLCERMKEELLSLPVTRWMRLLCWFCVVTRKPGKKPFLMGRATYESTDPGSTIVTGRSYCMSTSADEAIVTPKSITKIQRDASGSWVAAVSLGGEETAGRNQCKLLGTCKKGSARRLVLKTLR